MSRNRKERGLQLYRDTGTFEEKAFRACFVAVSNDNTREAYSTDLGCWFAFCTEYRIDPAAPTEDDVTAWVKWMKDVRRLAPLTRGRRMAALSTIYRRLRKNGVVPVNPFSIDDGPDRERVHPLERTPIAPPTMVKKLLETCDASIIGVRDTAMLRFLWGTGVRSASVLGMTIEGMRKTKQGYETIVIGKGGKEIRVLVRGKAATAMEAWIATLKADGVAKGQLWRKKTGPMTRQDVWRMIVSRSRKAGIDRAEVSAHSFRVAFLTYNPASLDEKQDAAGHADMDTTRSYDRASWRGRGAFEKMPEVEDTEEI